MSFKYFLLLGFSLSLGCLTKVIFIPITVGILSFWLLREWKLRGRIGFLKTAKLCSFVIVTMANLEKEHLLKMKLTTRAQTLGKPFYPCQVADMVLALHITKIQFTCLVVGQTLVETVVIAIQCFL